MSNWDQPRIIDIPAYRDELGALAVVEGSEPFPFPLKRVYYIYDVAEGAVRGSHAHKALSQMIVAVAGSFTVELDDGYTKQNFTLDRPDNGLTVPPGYWRTLSDFALGSAALVFASAEYDVDDYIRDYDVFLDWVARG